jgi:hypothetical protein
MVGHLLNCPQNIRIHLKDNKFKINKDLLTRIGILSIDECNYIRSRFDCYINIKLSSLNIEL